MTCMNVWVESDRALLAVDTAVHVIAGPLAGASVHGSKLLVLPHAGVALAGAGAAVFFLAAFGALTSADGVRDFDSAALVMPSVLRSTLAQVPVFLAQTFPSEDERAKFTSLIQQQELLLVGWSRRAQQMVAMRYAVAGLDRGEFSSQELMDGQCAICPGEGVGLPEDPPDTADAMAALMRRQIAFVEQTKPHMLPGFGGEMMTAEITRDAIQLRRRPLVAPGF